MKHFRKSSRTTCISAILNSCFFWAFATFSICSSSRFLSLSFARPLAAVDAGKQWMVFYFCAATSLFFFALSLNATCPVTWSIRFDRHGARECCLSFSLSFLLPHLKLSLSIFLALFSAQRLFQDRNWKRCIVLMFISPFQACAAFLSVGVSEYGLLMLLHTFNVSSQ